MTVETGASPRRRHTVIAALGITQILAWGSSYYLLAVLGKPIAADTGWPFSWVIGAMSAGLLVSGLSAIKIGKAIDQFGGRPVLAASSLLMAIGLVLLSVATNLTLYVSAWLVLGLAMGAGLYDAAFSTLGRLYGATARSAITTLTLWGGFASTVCWPLSALLVNQYGWRTTCLVYAALQLLIALPLHLFVIPREQARLATHQQSGNVDATPVPNRKLLFGLLMTMFTFAGVISATWSVHAITFIQSAGVGLALAVTLASLVGPSQVGARIVEMSYGGKHHPIWTMTFSTALIALGVVLLRFEFAVPAIALIAYGAGNGILSISRGTLPLALFGTQGYAILIGQLALPALLAQAAGPSIAAVLIEKFGTSTALTLLAALALANVVGVAALHLVYRASNKNLGP